MRPVRKTITIRSKDEFAEVKKKLEEIRNELADDEEIEVKVAKSGAYVLKMIVRRNSTEYVISRGRQKLKVVDRSDVESLKKILNFLSSQLV